MKGDFFACLEGKIWKILQILIENFQKSSKISIFQILYYFGPKRAKIVTEFLKLKWYI